MAVKKITQKKPAANNTNKNGVAPASGKAEKNSPADEDEDPAGDVKSSALKKGKTKAVKAVKKEEDDADDEDDAVGTEQADEWEKNEDDTWDPDFDEFDVPTSKIKKASSKKTKDDDDDLKLDDDFKEFGLFNEETGGGRGGRGGLDDDDDF